MFDSGLAAIGFECWHLAWTLCQPRQHWRNHLLALTRHTSFLVQDSLRSSLDASFHTFFHKHVYAPNHHHRTDQTLHGGPGGFMDSQRIVQMVDV
jgi:hypothetical protein